MKSVQSPKSEVRSPNPEPAAVVPLAVTSLSQLEQLSNGAPVIVDATLRGQLVRFTGRRLKPVESKEVSLLLEESLPPMLPPEKEGEPVRYDYRNPQFLRQVEENRRKARALALHASFPLFAEALKAEDGPVDAARIVAMVEGAALDDDVLDLLFKAVIERVVEAAAYVGFSSGSSFPRNS